MWSRILACVSVTGANGFIGSHIVDDLLKLGYIVRGIFRNYPGLLRSDILSHPNFSYHIADLTDLSALEYSINGSQFIIHLACGSLPSSSNFYEDISINMLGSINVLNAANKLGVERVVFLSSGGTVYGVPESIPITEEHSTNPICSYGITKLAIEKYFSLYDTLYDLDALVLRVSNPYGEHQRVNSPQGVIPIFVNRALQSKPLEIWGNGTNIRDYLYISDLTSALLSSLRYQGNERLFNIGSGRGHTILQIVSQIECLLNRPVDVNFHNKRGFDVPTNILSIDRAKVALKWEPKVSLNDGLAKVYAAMRSKNYL